MTTLAAQGEEDGSIKSYFNISSILSEMISCLALGCGLNPCLVGRESPVSISCLTVLARPKSYSDSENTSRYFTSNSDNPSLCLRVKDLSTPPTRSAINGSLAGVFTDDV